MASSENPSRTENNKTLIELKIKAKIVLKSYRKDTASLPKWASKAIPDGSDVDPHLKLKTMLGAVAKKAGFKDWQHASHVFGGHWKPGDDAGTFWHSAKCRALLNIWCRDLAEAEEQLAIRPGSILFPYKKQFVVADENYARALGLQNQYSDLMQETNRNLALSYTSSKWDEFAFARALDIFGD